MTEKITLGWKMSNSITDPPLVIMGALIGAPLAALTVSFFLWQVSGFFVAVFFLAAAVAGAAYWYSNIYLEDGPAPNMEKYIEFKDKAAKQAWAGRRIPIATLCELYLADKVAFKKDVLEVLRDHRNEFVNYKLTWSQVRFLVLQLFPNEENSSMKHIEATRKEIADHYDRGNDFFEAFLGPRMVYTCAVFEGLDQSLETAQDNKMSLICEKLMVKKGDRVLDIGCGWGTLLRHAAKHFGCEGVGVTLSKEGHKYCTDKAKEEGLADQVKTLCMDYRQIDKDLKFDAIASIEMAEHVGLNNFQLYLGNVKHMLKDEGMFLMQVAGLRQGSNWEDVAWGLFMSRYIFPGADASTPLNWYVQQMEKAGFEVHSVETIGRQYSHTLHKWYDNFQRNRAAMEKAYGGHLCRLWDFFLAWSVVAAGQGSASCYQILAHKNAYDFPRDIFCDKNAAKKSVGLGRK